MKRTCWCGRRALATDSMGRCLSHANGIIPELRTPKEPPPPPPPAGPPVRGVTCLCGCGKLTKGWLYAKGHTPKERRKKAARV